MTTTQHDFKVKNGLQVTGGASFGAPIAVPAPTHSSHAVTRGYVEENVAPVISSTAPLTPTNGRMWFDTSIQRLKVFYGSAWITMATDAEALSVADHIHDTALDGDGRIETVFYDSSQYDDPQILTIEGGSPSSVTWDTILDGGSA